MKAVISYEDKKVTNLKALEEGKTYNIKLEISSIRCENDIAVIQSGFSDIPLVTIMMDRHKVSNLRTGNVMSINADFETSKIVDEQIAELKFKI